MKGKKVMEYEEIMKERILNQTRFSDTCKGDSEYPELHFYNNTYFQELM